MRKILITGAAGFVGRHFTKRFLDTGDEVNAVDNIVPHTHGCKARIFPRVRRKILKTIQGHRSLRPAFKFYRWLKVKKWSDYDNIYYCCTQKTASQWFRAVFNDPIFLCHTGLEMVPFRRFGHRIARIESEFPRRSIVTHLYIDYPTYVSIPKPPRFKAFFILRDPRDVVVSFYFSARYSHRLGWPITEIRQELDRLSVQDGMILVIDKLEEYGLFETQRSWMRSENNPNVRVFRYEAFARDNLEFLRELLNYMEVSMPAKDCVQLYEKHSFEKLAGGRSRGQEDRYSNYRKGVAGDWRNHFNGRIMAHFRHATNDIAAELGYDT